MRKDYNNSINNSSAQLDIGSDVAQSVINNNNIPTKSKTKDLTNGSPMKLILGFAIPMLLGMLFQQFYNLVDTISSNSIKE